MTDILIILHDRGFCNLYKELGKLLHKKKLGLEQKELVLQIIDALISYISKTGNSMVVYANLSKAVKEAKLPDLELGYRSGNLTFSKTLENLQKKFLLPEESENNEDLVSKSLAVLTSSSLPGKPVIPKFSPKSSTNQQPRHKGKREKKSKACNTS